MILITYFMPESMLIPKNTELVKLALPIQTGQVTQQWQTHTQSYTVTGRNGEGGRQCRAGQRWESLPDTRQGFTEVLSELNVEECLRNVNIQRGLLVAKGNNYVQARRTAQIWASKKGTITCRWRNDWEVGTVWSENMTAERVSQRDGIASGHEKRGS